MLRLTKHEILIFFLLVPLFMPTYFEVIPGAYVVYRLGVWLGILYMFLNYIRFNTFPRFISILIILYQLLLIFLTIRTNGQIGLAVKGAEKILLMVLLADFYSVKWKNFLNALLLNFEIVIYINFITILFFSEGFFSRYNLAYGATKEWFLGASNNMLFWMFPALVTAWICRSINNKRLRCYTLTLVIFISQLLKGSATGKVAVVLLILLLIITHYINVKSMHLIFLSGIIFMFITFLRNLTFLEPIVVGMLGKKLTFSNRTYIWDNAMHAINANIFGYGVQQSDKVVALLGDINGFLWIGSTHAHNQLLQILFQGGIVGIIIFSMIYITTINKIKSINANLYAIFIFLYTLVAITENLESVFMYLIFPLIYFSLDYERMKLEGNK